MRHSRNEAERLGTREIAPEHLLLGLIRKGEGLGFHVLQRMRLTPTEIQQMLEARIDRTADAAPGIWQQNLPSRRIARIAEEIAAEMGNTWVGTEHLLLALLKDDDGLPGKVLREFQIDFEKTKKAVLDLTAELDAAHATPQDESREDSR
jgi:ATP-dependent Clp protease ATP-binding subunit ClpC